MLHANKHRPFYRQVIPESLHKVWQARSLWWLAFPAGLTQTAGIYDVLLVSLSNLPEQARDFIHSSALLLRIPNFLHASPVITSLQWIEHILTFVLIMIALFCLSLIAQGALVYGINHTKKETPPLKDCLQAGARALPQVLCLNIFTLGFIWLSRMLLLLPYLQTLPASSVISMILFSIGLLLFLTFVTALTSIHLLALHAIVLDHVPVSLAIQEAVEDLKRHWILILEQAGVLFSVAFTAFAGVFFLFLVASIPLFLLLISASLLELQSLVTLSVTIGSILFFLSMLTLGLWTIMFQYTVWGNVYHRLHHGIALSKIQRWCYWLFGKSAS